MSQRAVASDGNHIYQWPVKLDTPQVGEHVPVFAGHLLHARFSQNTSASYSQAKRTERNTLLSFPELPILWVPLCTVEMMQLSIPAHQD